MNDALKEINHIVVLMLENRSFDHMLGYLSLEGGRGDVDGLTGNEVNEHPAGAPHGPRLMNETVFDPDPHHDWDQVKLQLDNNNGGFVANFAAHEERPTRPERVMHFHNAAQLPAFDHLAREFCVCDRWFSSVPGATQPNRIYALAGHCNGEKNNLPLGRLLTGGWNVKPIFEFLPAGVTWRYYSHDIASLRFVRGFQGIVPEIDKITAFFRRAEEGRLTNVTFIDPDFDIMIPSFPGPPNDDHPPHDMRNGQRLVADVYNALVNGPREQWERTLLIVAYDEHGGFFDHVSPRQFSPADDREEFRQYGVRVPALVVSPWVGRQVCFGSRQGVVFDHTSILKTILLRFCTPPGGASPKMTARVDAAQDLGVLLTEAVPRTDFTAVPELEPVTSFNDRFVILESPPTEAAGRTGRRARMIVQRPPTELQQTLEALAKKAIEAGVAPEKL